MARLAPLLVALAGLATGIGAGLALRPAPEAAAACGAEAGAPCPAPETPAVPEIGGEPAYVAMARPFVVPVFRDERVAAMVVVSLSVETARASVGAVEGMEPRLRDSFLKVMFRHANSGGFDGSFTGGQKLQDLKAALRGAALEVLPDAPVGEVLITEIARQDD